MEWDGMTRFRAKRRTSLFLFFGGDGAGRRIVYDGYTISNGMFGSDSHFTD